LKNYENGLSIQNNQQNILLLFLTTWIFGFPLLAQKNKSQEPDPAEECPGSEEAKKLYEKSRDKKKYEYAQRIKFLEQAVEEDPNYAPANFELGLHWQRRADEAGNDCEKCIQYFRTVIQNCPKFHSSPYFYLGYFYYNQAKYDSAIKYAKLFLDFKEDNTKKYDKLKYERLLVDAKNIIKYSKFNKEMYDNPVPYDPKILEGVSTQYNEYLPFITPDNQIIFFTRMMPIEQKNISWTTDAQREVFSFSERQPNGKFNEGQPMPSPPFNRYAHEGGATLTIDNKHLFYTVAVGDNYDIYTSDFINGQWTESRNLGKHVNSDAWDSQPSISADGNTLYFASNRPGGYGGVDIWKTEKMPDGSWSPPINLGPNINTPGDEKSPFLHWDSKTLYFSSGDNDIAPTSHLTVGGFDIFYVQQDSTGKWGKPKNIGYPINTQGDDVGLFVSSDGKYGYFSSNNPQKTLGKTVGGIDIYYFELPQNVRADEVTIIKGRVSNDDGSPVSGAQVELKDVVTKQVTKAVVDSTTAEFVIAANVKMKHDMLIVVKKEGYAFSSQLLSEKDSSTKKFFVASNPFETPKIATLPSAKPTLELKTDSVKEGKVFTLNNIYFGPNKADLKEESKFVLDEFAEYLKANPSIVIDIYGHTDNIGNDQDNQNLSAERAFTVFEYLRNKGVPKGQIRNYRGFGESRPIASNDSEEGRAKNRRTEFVIIKK
jgi:outer membrane protein OmpA-like peptidoglycan-associated protein